MLFVTGVFALGQSHPSWWTLASPDATALVGMRWDNLKQSVFAEAISAELASTGSLGFPGLPCLRDANQILISSPALLAIVTGSFPTATLSQQTSAAHMQPATYKNVTLWISPGRTLSVAQLSDQFIIIGLRKTLEGAIDRFEETREGAEFERHYSPLLARAAHYTSKDLWVVATQLPDPLASLFVPIENESKNFDGSISLQNGLHLEGTLDAGSDNAAQIIGENLRGSIPSLPAVAHDLQVTVDAQRVLLALEVSPEQLVSGLRQTSAPPVAPAPLPVPVAAEAKPAGPQVIRIFGLDEGTREIVLAPTKPPQF
jgi:hypothetical protein